MKRDKFFKKLTAKDQHQGCGASQSESTEYSQRTQIWGIGKEGEVICGTNISGRVYVKTGNGYDRTKSVQVFPSGQDLITCVNKFNNLKKQQIEEALLIEEFNGLSIEEKQAHPEYAYSRSRNYGITFYARSAYGCRGVVSVGGCSNEEMDKVKGCLSPTEGLSSKERI